VVFRSIKFSFYLDCHRTKNIKFVFATFPRSIVSVTYYYENSGYMNCKYRIHYHAVSLCNVTYIHFIVRGFFCRDNNNVSWEYGSSSIWYHRPRVDNWNYLHLRWLSRWEFKSIVIHLWSEVNDRNHSVTLKFLC
jgi:hypothetical protein